MFWKSKHYILRKFEEADNYFQSGDENRLQAVMGELHNFLSSLDSALNNMWKEYILNILHPSDEVFALFSDVDEFQAYQNKAKIV